MASQTFTTLWKVLVGAFLALFAALGLASPVATAATPVSPQPQGGTCEPAGARLSPAPARYFAPPVAKERSLPPTMKQRIRAEQHGSSPSCRQLAVPFGLPPTEQGPTDGTTDERSPERDSIRDSGTAAPAVRDTAHTTRTQPGNHSAGPRDDDFGTAPLSSGPVRDSVIGATDSTRPALMPAPSTTVPGPADALDSVLPSATDAYLLPGTVTSPGIPAAREHQDRPQGHATSAGPGDSTPYVTSAP